MVGDQDTMQLSRGLAAIRAAEALLRTLGGCTIWIRVPINMATGDSNSQLGLENSGTQDIALFPAVARNFQLHQSVKFKLEITVSAASVAQAKDIHDAEGATDFFKSALGVVYSGKLLRIENVLAEEFGGVPYLYRLIVNE